MEDDDFLVGGVIDRLGLLETGDLETLGVVVRVALGADHHAARGARVERELGLAQLAGRSRPTELDEVALEARHDRLRLGVAETRVELEDLRARGRDHHACVEHAAERDVHALERIDRRHEHIALDDAQQLGRRLGRRAERAHAAGVRPRVAFADALVILRGIEHPERLSVAQREHADLGTAQQFLDQDRAARIAKHLANKAILDGAARFVDRLAHDHALAGAEAGGLDHAAVDARGDVRKRLLGVGKRAAVARRHARGAHDLLGERLVPFELRASLGRTKDKPARRIGELGRVVGGQRHFGTDDDERNILTLAPTRDAERVVDRLRAGAADLEDARVRAWLDPEGAEAAALLQPPRECVFAPSGTEEEDVHSVGAAKFGHWGRTL